MPNTPDLLNDGTPQHGRRSFASVTVDGYSLEMEDAHGLVGDQASETAFRELLRSWQGTVESAGPRPFGRECLDDMSREELDRLAAQPAAGDGQAVRTLALAINEFSGRLARVIGRFMQDPTWHGVEHVAVGGGFKESLIGRLAIRGAESQLDQAGIKVPLRVMHSAADEGGLLGWASIPDVSSLGPAFLAIDIGGTNVRCGIVEFLEDAADGQALATVPDCEKWRHANDDPARKDLVEGIVDMLHRRLEFARARGLSLAPFIGVACPGIICADGSIDRGADNLPGDWSRASFHLPQRLRENVPQILGEPTRVVMHNDAVIQGLSELPWLRDARRWAAVTIGTGLGNASYANQG